jgi:hypothetical protein
VEVSPLLKNTYFYHAPAKQLDIIIPCFKRPQGAVVAATSVLRQIKQYDVADQVNLIIWDDSTPGLDIGYFAQSLSDFDGLFRLGQNNANKGMSGNIYDLVSSSKSTFCTILTDDDWLEDDSLPEILDEIGAITASDNLAHQLYIGAFFVPRYSYLEDGSLHCIECKPFACDSLIPPSPWNVMRYCRNAFILTGLFFRPALVNLSLWQTHKANSFFPLFYYSSIAISSHVKFLDRKWLHHTCLNLCHWEAWGETDLQRYSRLHSDYLRALVMIAHIYPSTTLRSRLACTKYLWQALVEQLRSYVGPRQRQFVIVLSVSRFSIIPILAFLSILFMRPVLALRARLQVLKRVIAIN